MARILIVDDALFMRETLKKILSSAGHEVVGEAEDGSVAVDLYRQHHPDLTLCDITMPVKDGLEALADIMAADANAKVVMCSALGQENKVRQSIAIGARDYLVKPFTPDKLLEAVERVLA